MRIHAAVNGARLPGTSGGLPLSPQQLEDDARAIVDGGAVSVHAHPRDADGYESLQADAITAGVGALRRGAGAVPVGVSTGAWIEPDPARRLELVAGWTVVPDFASVNWHEPHADELAAALIDRGIGIEAGLFHPEAVHAWRSSPTAGTTLRVLLELPDGLSADATAEAAESLIAALGETPVEVVLHGEGSSCWPALREAARRELSGRIGLEDTLTLPDGSPADSNAQLLAAARDLVAS